MSDSGDGLQTNYVSTEGAADFAARYRKDQLTGGHVIQLGPGNREAALDALAAWPGGLQIGGGITIENAQSWLEAGADKVILTSWLFDHEGAFSWEKLAALTDAIGSQRLVIDLSCRRTEAGWTVAMNRWQTLTNLEVTHENLDLLAEHCAEFLIHAADVEGLCQGVDEDLVRYLGEWAGRPMTYAGGVSEFADIERVNEWSQGRVDLTVGSALDLFGGSGVRYDELVRWNQGQA